MNRLFKFCCGCLVVLISGYACHQCIGNFASESALGSSEKSPTTQKVSSTPVQNAPNAGAFAQSAQALLSSAVADSDIRWQSLLSEWAKIHPAEATQFLVEASASASLLGPVVEIWASQNPKAAIDFLSQHQDAAWFDQVYLRLLAGFASKDVAAASRAFFSQVSSGCDLRYAKAAVELLGGKAQDKGVEALVDWASDFPDIPIAVRKTKSLSHSSPNHVVIKSTPLKRVVGSTVVNLLLQEDPAAARSWIEQNIAQPWGDYQWALPYGEYLAKVAPAERVAWLASLNLRQDLIDTLVTTSDPARVHADPFNLDK